MGSSYVLYNYIHMAENGQQYNNIEVDIFCPVGAARWPLAARQAEAEMTGRGFK